MEAPTASSNHTGSSSPVPALLQTLMEQKKAFRFNNHSNPALELQEEIMASFYILIIVGFFGFLLFVMMLGNIVSGRPENYLDYLYSGKLSPARSRPELPGKDTKDSKDIFVVINSSALLGLQGQEGTGSPGPEGPGPDSALGNV